MADIAIRKRRLDNVENRNEPALQRRRSRSPEPQQVAPDQNLPPPEPIEVDLPPPRRPATHGTPPRKPEMSSSQGITLLIDKVRCVPTPTRPMVPIVFNSVDMNPYFTSLRNSLLNVLYAGEDNPDDLITEANWNIVCRWLTKARIDTVYGKVAGERRAGRIAIPTEFSIPKALADIINGIGLISVNSSALLVCPEPEAAPAEQGQALNQLCTMAMRNAFAALVRRAETRGFIKTGRLSMAAEGQSWWMLSPRTITHVVADELTDVVRVCGFFPEFLPTDVMIAAIVRRGFDGHTPNDPITQWTSDAIRGVNALRDEFNIKA